MGEDTRLHQEVWSLLPWLASGRASPEQRERAEAHLRGCPGCRAELARELQLMRVMAQPVAPAPDAERGLQRLLRRRDQPGEPATGSERPHGRAGVRVGLGTVAWLGLLELLLVGALAWWWSGGLAGPSAEAPYRTLTAPELGAATGPRWRVVFQDQRAIADLQALLRAHGLAIVAGPSEAGVFTLVAEVPPGSAQAADAVAARLRASPLVRFAETAPARGQP